MMDRGLMLFISDAGLTITNRPVRAAGLLEIIEPAEDYDIAPECHSLSWSILQ